MASYNHCHIILVGTLGYQTHFTYMYICVGLFPPLNVESNRSWFWQSLLSILEGGVATSVPTNVTTIARMQHVNHSNS